MLWLLNSDFGAMKKTLKLNPILASFSFSKTYKIYLTATFTHVFSELCKNKSLRYWNKATLTLETR